MKQLQSILLNLNTGKNSIAGFILLALLLLCPHQGWALPVTGDLALWLRADQGVTIDTSGTVTGWTDQL